MKKIAAKLDMRSVAVVCLSFLLASTGYLAWLYNIMDLVRPEAADALSLCAGYMLQAVGIGLFALLIRSNADMVNRILHIILPVFIICLFPAVFSSYIYVAVVFGLLLNLACGMLSGYYLFSLARGMGSGGALSLGVGYTLSILGSFFLSLLGRNNPYYDYIIMAVCLLLAAAVLFVSRLPVSPAEGLSSHIHIPKNMNVRSLCLLAGALVVLFSIVNSCGFAFPSSQISGGISLETSRLFYGAGLIIAGAVSDKSRKTGAICVLAALIIPFIMLTLRGAYAPLIVLWALGYFTFGFFTIYRIILFVDISRSRGLLCLSGLGLMFGRIGDAIGEVLNLALTDSFPVLSVVVPAVLFVISIFLFFNMQHLIYGAAEQPVRTEKEIFDSFSARHDLSARERDVLRLILQEKNNAEIADVLSVSESTVKFHVHNLLQKTGCRNRVTLLDLYSASRNS